MPAAFPDLPQVPAFFVMHSPIQGSKELKSFCSFADSARNMATSPGGSLHWFRLIGAIADAHIRPIEHLLPLSDVTNGMNI